MKNLTQTEKLTTEQRYLTYSYDVLAIFTSLIAMLFIGHSIYLLKVSHVQPQQNMVITLVVVNFACILASFLFKHKLDKQSL